mgnify:CR=1 FL=1
MTKRFVFTTGITGGNWYRQEQRLRAAAVPARGGYTAVSIDDYSRISSKRDEFLNFLLLPNPEGIPAIEYAGLRVA